MSKLDLIAFCGIDCSECPAYVSKRTGDIKLKQQTAEKWSSPDTKIKPEDISCDGCTVVNKELFRYCNECLVRICGLEKDVLNCAHCSEYSCEKLEGIWKMFNMELPKENLEKIRKIIGT